MTISATTVKLPSALKKRVDGLARSTGKTTHAWLVDTIANATEAQEAERAFVARALASKRAVDAGEQTYSLDESLAQAEARLKPRTTKKRR